MGRLSICFSFPTCPLMAHPLLCSLTFCVAEIGGIFVEIYLTQIHYLQNIERMLSHRIFEGLHGFNCEMVFFLVVYRFFSLLKFWAPEEQRTHSGLCIEGSQLSTDSQAIDFRLDWNAHMALLFFNSVQYSVCNRREPALSYARFLC